MNIEALYHCPISSYAFAYNKNEIRIRFRTAKDDVCEVQLYYGMKFDWANKKMVKMNKIFSDQYYDYYQSHIIEEDTRIGYYFEVLDEGESLYYTEAGISDEFDDSKAYCLFFQYPNVHENDLIKKPAWFMEAVFYQIFVERFANGIPEISRDNLVPWNSIPTPKSFYGGDLEGIRKHLEYIVDLGVNALYLTPIFTSTSNHKYDTVDYMEIDPHFGDKYIFKRFVQEAHELGIRIVLDGVFNHCSDLFGPFQDVVLYGEASKYKDWFLIESFPLNKKKPNYKTFGKVSNMPRFNTANAEVREYLFSVVRYWTKEFMIDGWRLDVADEPDHNFWREFRKVVKELDSDLIIIGENWHDSQPWLLGDQFDTVMNYPVTYEVVNYIAKGTIDAREFTQRLVMRLMKYQDMNNELMFNLLDSHDTERFLFLCKENKKALKLAAAFLFSYIGTPCVYYGTEIGITGGYDPGCRRGFCWEEEEWDNDLLLYYKRLIQIHKEERAFQNGGITFFSTNELFIMKRSFKEETIVVVINQTKKVQKLPQEICKNAVTELIYGSLPKQGEILPETAYYLK